MCRETVAVFTRTVKFGKGENLVYDGRLSQISFPEKCAYILSGGCPGAGALKKGRGGKYLLLDLGGRLSDIQTGPSQDELRRGLPGLISRAEFTFDSHSGQFGGVLKCFRPRNMKIEHFSLIFSPLESRSFVGSQELVVGLGVGWEGTLVWYIGLEWNGIGFMW